MEGGDKDAILKEFNIDNCRVCIDINSWNKKAQQAAFGKKAIATGTAAIVPAIVQEEVQQVECPPDSADLGRATWTFLHTMAAYYPERPTPSTQSEMSTFIQLFSKFYPCSYCASHLREELKTNIPQVTSRHTLSQWFCRLHNEVNERLGKPIFDCNQIDERWRDGPKDGSC